MTCTVYSRDFFEQARQLIGRLSEMLMARSMLLGTAESCTGGLASMLCTEEPGSSAWFAGGVVSYANEVKRSLLGVEESLLAGYGAVSREVAEAMARGALPALNAHLGIAISGVAGPGGGTAEKPVGTVWIASACLPAPGGPQGKDARVLSECFLFSGSRQAVRANAVLRAFHLALEQITFEKVHLL